MRITLVLALLLQLSLANAQSTGRLEVLPIPAKYTLHPGRFPLTASFRVAIQSGQNDSILLEGINRFYQTLNRRRAIYFNTEYITGQIRPDSAAMIVEVANRPVPSNLVESYSLEINSQGVRLSAPTTQGALHGLETILQLPYKEGNNYYFPFISIQDEPRFGWRGLMIDVARHFIPVEVIERNLDAMATVKMNILHLHLADDEGFRVESRIFPLLQQKGSNGEFYTQDQIKHIVTYAKKRGITIVPEFDMPGHTTSWFAGYPELASAPGPYEPGPRFKNLNNTQNVGEIMKIINTTPTATMDPTRESTYHFLEKFFGEMATLFPSAYVHIGCDENNGIAWMRNPSIDSFMKKNGIPDAHALQAYFANRVTDILAKFNKKAIGWEEILSGNISPDITVQIWNNASYRKKALQDGHSVLISKGFYLDQFFPAYIHYNNEMISSSDSLSKSILGGEAAMWTEAVDKYNIDIRIWPRAAAIAERLWSPASANDIDDLYERIFILNRQLDDLGLQQISDYEKSLRLLAEEKDIVPLKTLTDVLTPVKGYKKMFAKIGKPSGYLFQAAPLIAVSDIIPVDNETKWHFRKIVAEYLRTKSNESQNEITDILTRWRDNKNILAPYFQESELLSEVKQQSENLSEAASIGLEAIAKSKNGVQISQDWINEKMNKLKEFRKSYSETELAILSEIESLVTQKLVVLPANYPIF